MEAEFWKTCTCVWWPSTYQHTHLGNMVMHCEFSSVIFRKKYALAFQSRLRTFSCQTPAKKKRPVISLLIWCKQKPKQNPSNCTNYTFSSTNEWLETENKCSDTVDFVVPGWRKEKLFYTYTIYTIFWRLLGLWDYLLYNYRNFTYEVNFHICQQIHV